MRRGSIVVLGLCLAALAGCGKSNSNSAEGKASRADFMLLTLRPQRLVSNPLIAPLLMFVPQLSQFGDPAEIEEVSILGPAGAGEDVAGSPLIRVRFAKSMDVKAWLTKLMSQASPRMPGEAKKDAPLAEKTCGGKTCFVVKEQEPVLAYAADDRTLLVAAEKDMPAFLGESQPASAVRDLSAKAGAENDLVLALVLDPVRAKMEKKVEQERAKAPPAAAPFVDLPLLLKSGLFQLNLGGDPIFRAVLEAKDGPSAEKVEKLLQDAMAQAREAMEQKDLPPQAQMAKAVFSELLSGAKLVREGNSVTLSVKRPKAMDLEQAKPKPPASAG